MLFYEDIAIGDTMTSPTLSVDRDVMVEFAKTGDVMTLLRSFGCDLAQGYHVCKPKSANEFNTWLRTQPTQTETLFAPTTSTDLYREQPTRIHEWRAH